jgi:hypothetical protein
MTPNSNNVALLIHLPCSLVDKLNEAALAFNLPRTHVIRRSLARDMNYMVQNEQSRPGQARQHQDAQYLNWARATVLSVVACCLQSRITNAWMPETQLANTSGFSHKNRYFAG